MNAMYNFATKVLKHVLVAYVASVITTCLHISAKCPSCFLAVIESLINCICVALP